MALIKFPRLLPASWTGAQSLLPRYWDLLCNAVESLNRGVFTGTLPDPAKLNDRAFVLDATTTVFYDVYVPGGSSPAPVFYDGTDWRIG